MSGAAAAVGTAERRVVTAAAAIRIVTLLRLQKGKMGKQCD